MSHLKARPKNWPKDAKYRNRYFVPDLSPEQRSELTDLKAKIVFVAESPHEAETQSPDDNERRPLCGKAGRDWWRMVGGIVAGEPSTDTDLERLLRLCRKGRLVVMNAVQFPLDPKITVYYGEEANPLDKLGFTKVAPASYKKLRSTDSVQTAIAHLRERLVHASVAKCPVVSLGLDAQWFVSEALGSKPGIGRHLITVPHPSAWWRAGGKFREKARGQLTSLFEGHLEASYFENAKVLIAPR